jgi:drug/metabolite transporter (DMT)-like permease
MPIFQTLWQTCSGSLLAVRRARCSETREFVCILVTVSHYNPVHWIRGLATASVLLNVGGNYSLSVGMRQIGATLSLSPAAYLPAFTNLWILLGICLLAAWLIAQLSLLSRADLSYVLPITASAYVLTTLLGALTLHEHVSFTHWVGVGLIFTGVMVVGRTHPRTTRPAEPASNRDLAS